MLAAPHTSLPRSASSAAHYAAVAAAVGLPIVLYNYPARAGVEIGFDVPRRGRRPARDRRAQGVERRLLALPHAAPAATRTGSGHVRLGRPGRRLLLVGRPLAGSPARRTCCPASTSTIIDAANAATTRWRTALFERHPAVGAGHGGRLATTRRRSSASRHLGIACGDVRQPLLPLDAATAAEQLRRSTRRSPCRSLPA